MPRNRENWRIFEPIFEPQFDGFCVKIIYKIATFWVAGQQFIGHPVYPPSGGFLVVELQPFSLRKDTKIEIFGGKMTHVPPQTTSFLAYFPHSSGFFPPWERPEFVKKSHFLDETTPAEKTSNREKRQEFYPFSSLQMTKVPCGRASDPALPPSQGFAVLRTKMWQKIRQFSRFLGTQLGT